MIKQDLLERIIEQLGEALARATKSRAAGRHAEALRTLEAAYGSLFGLDLGLIRSLDAQTLHELLQDEREVELLARLMRHEAEQLLVSGQAGRGMRVATRALALFAQAARGRRLDAVSVGDVRSLIETAGVEGLHGEDRHVLQRMVAGEDPGTDDNG